MLSDGSRLRESWSNSLNEAQSFFRSLLVSSSSSSWKRVPIPSRDTSSGSGSLSGTSSRLNKSKTKARSLPQLGDVVVHRKSQKSGDVLRAVVDLTIDETFPPLDAWKAVLATPEMRKEWDPSVQDGHVVEMFDPDTRITKTDFALGWPANPRDAITISRTFSDATTIIDVSTSLPRSTDEPAYLRPAPPFVRSHVHLFAWCIQLIQPPQTTIPDTPSKYVAPPTPTKLRITCFWQHDLKAILGMGGAISQSLPAMLVGLIKVVRSRGNRMPLLTGYGLGVGIELVSFEVGRQLLTIEYSIIPDDDDDVTGGSALGSMNDDLHALKERRRLERRIECELPGAHGWDVQVSTRTSSPASSSTPLWTVRATRSTSLLTSSPNDTPHILFQVAHPRPNDHTILKVKVAMEPAGGSKSLRVNGSPHSIHASESRDPSSFSLSRQMIVDASSISDLSMRTSSTSSSNGSSSSVRTKRTQTSGAVGHTRSSAAEKSIFTLVRRNYIYFTSLLQEPEAKWSKAVTEARGVTVTQLNSIDPTLVVYRAEAVFVGIGVWDLLSTITTPGVQVYWHKSHEDAVLLEDVNELTELWHFKARAAWPVNARDNVLLKTSYKSPTAVHVFSFSTDDAALFPCIPPPEPAVIRAQVDLQGWAIEALSPTTTLLTLLDQSDPKGWSNKSSIPSQMIAAVAGVGEFAIKCGGPPMTTRISGAKVISSKYDHERGTFRLAYEAFNSTKSATTSPVVVTLPKPPSSDEDTTPAANTIDLPDYSEALTSSPTRLHHPDIPVVDVAPVVDKPPSKVECELRCDIDTWAVNLDIVVDPPPQAVSCLKRHRLSSGGGGLWITIEHVLSIGFDEPFNVVVRKASVGKEKGVVMVNGARVKVDAEDLPDSEVKMLLKRKRIKPTRVPLDQPPVLGVIRRRRAELDDDADGDSSGSDGQPENGPILSALSSWTAPSITNPLGSLFNIMVEQAKTTTVAAAAALTPAPRPPPNIPPSAPLVGAKTPMQYALDALVYTRNLRERSTSDGWTLVSDKGNFPVHKKLDPNISSTIAVHKGQKVVEGFSAEELAAAINNYSARKQWDDRFDSAVTLEEYGNGCSTAFVVNKGGFLFRDRGFFVANATARLVSDGSTAPKSPPDLRARSISVTSTVTGPGASSPRSLPTTIFCASASYADTLPTPFSQQKVNPYNLPIGKLHLQGWILETLDPYTAENFPIPSTRCTYIVAVDYAGSVPAAYNSTINASLPRSILTLETYLAGKVLTPYTRLPAPALAINEREDLPNPTKDTPRHAWILDGGDDERTLMSGAYSPEDHSFRCTILIKPIQGAEADQDISILSESTETLDAGRKSPDARLETPAQPLTPTSPIRRIRPISSPPAPHSRPSTLPRSVRPIVRPTRSSSSLGGVFDLLKEADPDDLVICEIVIESRLYSDGYQVLLTTKFPDGSPSTDANGFVPDMSRPLVDPDEHSPIPVKTTIHSIPASHLVSNSLSSTSERHLLRFAIPSSAYTAAPLEDPLTGELRSPPLKPVWLLRLEELGGVLDVLVSPGKHKKGKILVNGNKMDVMSEKRSISILGGDNLEANRLETWPLLTSTILQESMPVISPALGKPLAAARRLYDDSVSVLAEPSATGVNDSDFTEKDIEATSLTVDDTSTTVINNPLPTPTPTPVGGLMGFFNSYTNPLLRLSAPSSPVRQFSNPLPSTDHPESSGEEPTIVPGTYHARQRPAPPSQLGSGTISPRNVSARVARRQATFTLSGVLLIALVAFLFGSLLRSLISPADFIYISEDGVDSGGNWRQVKRLVEIKYVLGGWDFVVAVVRRP